MKMVLIVVFHLVGQSENTKQMMFETPENTIEYCEEVSNLLPQTIPDNIVIVSTECVEM